MAVTASLIPHSSLTPCSLLPRCFLIPTTLLTPFHPAKGDASLDNVFGVSLPGRKPHTTKDTSSERSLDRPATSEHRALYELLDRELGGLLQ